jgi:hypothetical protein
MVMKALEKDRNRRYETASAFAEHVQHYLHDEPVRACPPSAWYRFRKFARRNRRALAVAGLVLAFFVLSGSSLAWVAKDRWARRASLEQETRQALAEAKRHLDKDELAEAMAAARRASSLIASNGEPTPRPVAQMLTDLELLTKVEDARLEHARSVRNDSFHGPAAARQFSAAFEAYGLPVLTMEPEASAARITASAIAPQLLAALDHWAVIADRADQQKLPAVAELADRDPLGRQIRAARARRDGQELIRLSRQPEILDQPTISLRLLAASLSRGGFFDEGLRQLARSARGRCWKLWPKAPPRPG